MVFEKELSPREKVQKIQSELINHVNTIKQIIDDGLIEDISRLDSKAILNKFAMINTISKISQKDYDLIRYFEHHRE